MATTPAIPNSDRIVSYSPVVPTTAYIIPWVVIADSEILAGNDLVVIVNGVTFNTSQFSFSGNVIAGLNGIWNGGTLTLSAAVSGVRVIIYSKRNPQRTGNFLEGKVLPFTTLDALTDDVVVQIRDLALRVSRSFKTSAANYFDNGDAEMTFSAGTLESVVAAFLAGVAPAAAVSGWARTLAAAKALYAAPVVLANGQLISVASRTTTADGYGGIFAYDSADAASTFTQDALGFVDNQSRRWKRVYSGLVDIRWFGAKIDAATDDTTAGNAAFASGSPVLIPTGTMLGNFTLPVEVSIVGAGSEKTIVRPFNTAIAAMTYTYRSGANNTYWAYNTVIQGIQFAGSGQVGIGFTCAQTLPASYTAGDENVGNVSFEHCAFLNLDKGFQAPFGNIRKQFLDCGWQGCRYGIYSIDAKFGGLMHAGNLYVRGGEFNVNDCAIYVDNNTDGFYAPEIIGTVFEGNKCNVRIKNAGGVIVAPIMFNGIGAEANGSVVNANVTLDVWTGTVKTTENIATPIWLFDGDKCHAAFTDSGIIGGIRVRSTNAIVRVDRCRVESSTGFGGQSFVVDVPQTSRIEFSKMHCDSGGVLNDGCVLADGRNTQSRLILNGGGFADFVPHRIASSAALGIGGVKVGFNTGAPQLSGTFNVIPTNPAGGVTLANYSHYTRNWDAAAFASAQGAGASPSTATGLTAGYWVFTVSTRTIAGAVAYSIWDESTGNVAQWSNPALNQWYTMGCVRYVNTTPTVFFDVGPGNNTTWTFDVQAFQARGPFATLGEAQDFLASGVWAA